MKIHHALMLTAALALSACDSEDGGESAASGQSGSGSGEASGESASEDQRKERRRERGKEDRGEGSMTLGGEPWEAERARFRIRDGKLKISLSRSDYDGKTSSRQSLDLRIKDFEGPGAYQVDPMGSRFIGVGIDIDKAKAAGKDDDKVKKEAVKAISGAKHMMLSGAKVTISEATDDQIVGTFSWQPPAGLDKPALEDGKFRAVKRKKRKKRNRRPWRK